VWVVSAGAGELRVNGELSALPGAGAHLVVQHERHESGELSLEALGDLEILATCFAPGLA
jgi:hypothetical protein